ncbi:MAG: response regulator transcription factor, partial [Betaproteobacteria bacterium]|nr:response regulator transcription factor [Betaproteobacteria bacterium]
MRKYGIVLVEDHRILRDGVRALISEDDSFEVLGEADDGRAAVSLVGKLKPDLVLLDLSLPGFSGLETLREIHSRYPETKVLIL